MQVDGLNLRSVAATTPERKGHERAEALINASGARVEHANGHSNRLNGTTLVKQRGFGSESYAREGLQAEIASMMTGEQNGAAAVDVLRISDCWMARERDRSLVDDQTEHERLDGRSGETQERVRPYRQRVAPNVPNYGQAPGVATKMYGAHAQRHSVLGPTSSRGILREADDTRRGI